MIDIIAYGLIWFGAVLVALGVIYRPDPNEEAYDEDDLFAEWARDIKQPEKR
jgi:hypothetical protein